MTGRLKKLFLFFIIFGFSGFLIAQETDIICRISYLSKENAYIDMSEYPVLGVGDTLIVEKNGQPNVSLVIIHTSKHSASCIILEQHSELRVGDLAKLVSRKDKMAGTSIVTVVPEKTPEIPAPAKTGGKPWARISGGLSVQLYHSEDISENNLDFDQPTLRFDLKAREIWGKNYNLIIRTRLRKNERSGSYSTGIAQESFRNRIYTFYFSYEDPTSVFNFIVGRIQSNQLSGVGYLDGLFLRFNLSSRLYIGVYGGMTSYWQFAGAEESRKKYGLVFGYRSDRSAASSIETSLAVNSEYNGKTISRENVYFRSSFILKNRLFIYNNVDLDINRMWRKEKTNEDISLSSFYLSARYRLSNLLMTGLSFDSRKSYYTYDTMEIPEDYYDMAARYSLGVDLNFYFPRNYTAFIQAGIRKRQNDTQTTYTGRASFRKSNLFIQQLSVGINLNLYSNYYTEGWVPTVFIAKSFSSGHYLSITGGQNSYRLLSIEQKRRNFWMRFNSQFSIWSGLYLSGYYNYDWGDDRQGYNFMIEIGNRF